MARREWVPVFARINTSGKLARLPNDTYRLFYLMLLPQCDGWGRAPADPGVLDALVWPRLKFATEVSGDALAACEAVGLLERHQTETGEAYVQVCGWEGKAGKVCNRMKRGASEWPDPTPKSRLSHDSVATSCDQVCRPNLLSSTTPAVVRTPAPSAPDGAAARAKEQRPRKEATGPHAEAIAWWHAEFLRTRGEPYAFCGGKDGDHVRSLLALRSDASEAQRAEAVSRFKQRSTALLESQDAFYAKADLGTLRSAWNKLAQAKPPRPSYDKPTEPETNGHKVDPVIARKAIKDALAAATGKPVEP